MPDTDILVSELNSASQINTTDLLLMTQPDGDSQTGYSSRKGTVLQVANKLLKDTEYTTDLPNFDNKSVFGALNEIHNGTYIYKENETPYQLRQTPITANRTLEKLVGCSVAFNQLVDLTQATSVGNFNIVNSYEMNCKIDITSTQYPAIPSITFTESHKYFVKVENGTSANVRFYYDTSYSKYNDTSANTTSNRIIVASGFTATIPFLALNAGALTGETIKINIIDLTACFGSEVADYLYNLEQNNAGSGIALFRQLFPEDYYAYQTATLISSKPVSKVVVGFNLFDESLLLNAGGWSLSGGYYSGSIGQLYSTFGTNGFWKNDINTNSQICVTYTAYVSNSNANARAVFVYADGTTSFAGVITTTTATTYSVVSDSGKVVNKIVFDFSNDATLNIKDFCINLHGDKDGQYEPYSKTTYPLGGDELRGLLKVENGQLVAYGDVKGSDGIIYRYFEERAYASGDESLPNAITDGTNTVVKLATPTTASGTPFTNPMLCGSTEEFTDSRSLKMFCGHDSLYYTSNFKYW